MMFYIRTKKLMFDRRDMELWFRPDEGTPVHLFDYSVATGGMAFFSTRGYEIGRAHV